MMWVGKLSARAMIGCNGSVTYGYSKNEVQYAPFDQKGSICIWLGPFLLHLEATRSMTYVQAYHITASRNGCTTQLQSSHTKANPPK
jgi:hypothetical protein